MGYNKQQYSTTHAKI